MFGRFNRFHPLIRRLLAGTANRALRYGLYQRQRREKAKKRLAKAAALTRTTVAREASAPLCQVPNGGKMPKRSRYSGSYDHRARQEKRGPATSKLLKFTAGMTATAYLAAKLKKVNDEPEVPFVDITTTQLDLHHKVALFIWDMDEATGAGHMAMQPLFSCTKPEPGYISFWPGPQSSELVALTPLRKVLGDGHSFHSVAEDITSEGGKLPSRVFILDIDDVDRFLRQKEAMERKAQKNEIEYTLFASKAMSTLNIKENASYLNRLAQGLPATKPEHYAQYNCVSLILKILEGTAPAVRNWSEPLIQNSLVPPSVFALVLAKQVNKGCVEVSPRDFLSLLYGEDVLKLEQQDRASPQDYRRIPLTHRMF